MNALIINRLDPVTLVGGGPLGPLDLSEALALAPVCVAADGGARHVLAAGRMPDAVIGDFDSLGAARDLIPDDRLFPSADQDTTDFEKVMAGVTAPVCIGVGFTGGRIDHQLAVFHGLLRFAARPCVLIGETEIVLLAPPQLRVGARDGDVVSLFPLVPVTGRSTGLVWPIEGLDFAPGAMVGTSNRATGPVVVEMDAPGMLCILPRRLIRQVLNQLALPSARWPVRG